MKKCFAAPNLRILGLKDDLPKKAEKRPKRSKNIVPFCLCLLEQTSTSNIGKRFLENSPEFFFKKRFRFIKMIFLLDFWVFLYIER